MNSATATISTGFWVLKLLAFPSKTLLVIALATWCSRKTSQSVKKIIEINPYMLGTMAGGAADYQFWHRNLGIKCQLHGLANKHRISVTGASKLLANILYSYCGMGPSVGTMIAGWDEIVKTHDCIMSCYFVLF
ncbi:proteasome subunit beta type-5-like [Quercus lobata]|uniref:proteasome subunit beta type-5-like n=1 Tax=Quercus lobata TaxID=97700 RepID=UPI001247903F|nr:proteasome subunit beta type-5-like [Quercus lobata]